MAPENLNHDALIPFKIILEINSTLIENNPPKEYDTFVASLPSSLSPTTPRLYQGFWIPIDYLLGILAIKEHFKPRPSDIFIASFPKSGTTWLKALTFATMTRNSCPLDQNPLLTNNPHQCIPNIDKQFFLGRRSVIEAMPSTRILSTHMPYSIIPNSIINSNSRIIYIWRDPKDVIVSLWHFVNSIFEGTSNLPTFAETFDLFCEGIAPCAPIWNHIIEYWQASRRKPENVLFLKYEDMLTEPVKYAKILAKFIGCPYSNSEEEQGVIEKIVELCSFGKLANLEVNKGGSEPILLQKSIPYSLYFRKGMVGDWRNFMTYEMAQRLDKIVADKFKEEGFDISEMKNEDILVNM